MSIESDPKFYENNEVMQQLSLAKQFELQIDLMEKMVDRLTAKTALLAMFVGPLRELCYEVEKLDASEQQTKVSILAADIAREIESIARGQKADEAVIPMSETMVAYRQARTELEKPDEVQNETPCSVCGYPEYKHSAITHEFEPML
jgi:hypothetical protein